MSNSPFDLAGTRPDPDKYAILAYRQTLISHAYAPLQESRKARATTYYVDSVAGSDSNDGLSTGAPFASLSKAHDMVQASSGDVRVRLKYGSEFIGKGKNQLWLTDATQHHVACSFMGKNNVTLDCYGTPSAGVVKFRVTVGGALGSSWTDSGDGIAYYCSAAGISGTPEIVYETDGSTATFSRQTSLANCQANARSFWYDSSNDRVYVNYAGSGAPPSTLYAIEGNTVTCFRFNGDDVIVDLGGAEFYGFGYLLAQNNSHDYAVGVQVDGTKVATIANLKAYYGSAHLVATWINTNQTNGHCSWLNISGHGGHAGRVINVYQSQSGMTTFCHNVRSEDVSSTGVSAVDGHSGGGETHGDVWIDSCYGRTLMASSATGRTTFFGCWNGSPTAGAGEASWPIAAANVINCVWFITPNGDASNFAASNGRWFNCILVFDPTSTGGGSTARGLHGFNTTVTNIDDIFNHCLMSFANDLADSTRGVGYSRRVVEVSGGAPTDAIANRTAFVRGDAYNASYPVGPGIGNRDSQQVQCSYYNVTKVMSRTEAGWSFVTTGVELSANPLRLDRGILEYSPLPEMVREVAPSCEYDFYGNRRRTDISTDGPVEMVPNEIRPDLNDWNRLLRSRNLGSESDTESAYEKLRRNLLGAQ